MAINIQNVPAEIVPTFKVDELNNKKLLVMMLYKYSGFSQNAAVQKIMEVDYIKNKFKKSTIICYLAAVRTYLKHKVKLGYSSYIYDVCDELIAKKYPKLRPSKRDAYSEPKPHSSLKKKLKEIQANESTLKLVKNEAKPDARVENIKSSLKIEIKNLELKRENLMTHLHGTEAQIEALKITLNFFEAKTK